MAKHYGEPSKDDLLEEVERLQFIVNQQDGVERAQELRSAAVNYAAGLHNAGNVTVDVLLEEAKKIEAYLSGKVQENGDPDTPVPSPS